MDRQPLDLGRLLWIGSLLWAVALIALLPFAGVLADAGRTWWIWCCLAGSGIGLLCWEFVRWRSRRSGS